MTMEAALGVVRPPFVKARTRTGPPLPPSLLARLRVLVRAYLASTEREWERTAEVQARNPTVA